MTEPLNDDGLISRLKAGDFAAFDELVKRYRKKIMGICYRFVLSVEIAEDLSQEVFIEIFRSVKSFRGEAGLATWIFRIAVTKSLDEIKRSKRRKRISSLGKIFHLNKVPDIAGDLPADGPLLEKDNRRILYEALNKLPDNQRVALSLSKIEGYSNKTIAGVMGLSVTAVEMLIHRGRKKLAAELENILKKQPFG